MWTSSVALCRSARGAVTRRSNAVTSQCRRSLLVAGSWYQRPCCGGCSVSTAIVLGPRQPFPRPPWPTSGRPSCVRVLLDDGPKGARATVRDRYPAVWDPRSPYEQSVVVAVIDSARSRLPAIIERWHESRCYTLLVVDECHRAGSEFNSRIFASLADAAIGLSATPERGDRGHEKVYKHWGRSSSATRCSPHWRTGRWRS